MEEQRTTERKRNGRRGHPLCLLNVIARKARSVSARHVMRVVILLS